MDDRLALYKSRPNPANRGKNDRAKEHKSRGKSKRSDVYFQNRQLGVTFMPTPIATPEPTTSSVSQSQPVMIGINKAARAMNFGTVAEERMYKMRELRNKQKNQIEKRSPFITVVPVGRIVQKKRDVLEDKMKEFHERQARIQNSTTKRRSINLRSKRKSFGNKLVTIKKRDNTRAVVAKPVIIKTRSRKSIPNENGAAASTVAIITDPVPGPSSMAQTHTPRLHIKHQKPALRNLNFLMPVAPQIPKSIKAKKAAVKVRESFNMVNSFVTSTASKNEVRMVPDNKPQMVHFTADDTLFDGISPLTDASPRPFTFTAKLPKRNTRSMEQQIDDDINVENVNSQEDVVAELNRTFTQEDEEISNESPVFRLEVSDGSLRRSIVRRSKNLHVVKSEVVEESEPKRRSISTISPVAGPSEDPELIEKQRIADIHCNVLNSETIRLKERIEIWKYEKSVTELPEHAIGMIDTAIGQTELLLRKKCPKFTELIQLYQKNNGGKKVLADDLDGWWQVVKMEIENIDKRFSEIEIWKANDWQAPQEPESEFRLKAKATRRRNKKGAAAGGTATSNLKDFLKKLRQNKVKPVPEIPEVNESVSSPARSKRSANTPRQSVPKRRSFNCSGCTPSSLRKSKKISLAPVNILFFLNSD